MYVLIVSYLLFIKKKNSYEFSTLTNGVVILNLNFIINNHISNVLKIYLVLA